MRDILLLAFIVGGALYALRQPWVGVILWTWVSLMNPHSQFGYTAASFPVAMTVAVTTLVGLLMTRDRQNPLVGSPAVALAFFTLWITITLPFSFYLDGSVDLWIRSMKIFLMLFVTLALIDSKRKLDVFVAVAVGSIAFYGVKGGVFTLLTGGNFRVWGPGGFIEGNNEIALAVVMTTPLLRYLQQQVQRPLFKQAFGVAMVLMAVTALGTYSRGALLALGAMAAFMWVKNDRKVIWAILLVGTSIVILPFMPDAWWDRMNTIQTYEEDSSAQGRINAWYMAFNLARSNFFGGGFNIYSPQVFELYAPDPTDVHAAHSIYFQVLGEHGFVGLAIFLSIWALTWNSARRIKNMARDEPSLQWAGQLGAMVQVGLIGYLVGGSFLSLAYFDLPFDLMAMVVIALRLTQRRLAELKAELKAAPAATVPGPADPSPADASAGAGTGAGAASLSPQLPQWRR